VYNSVLIPPRTERIYLFVPSHGTREYSTNVIFSTLVIAATGEYTRT
jgi:hypothetical protein